MSLTLRYSVVLSMLLGLGACTGDDLLSEQQSLEADCEVYAWSKTQLPPWPETTRQAGLVVVHFDDATQTYAVSVDKNGTASCAFVVQTRSTAEYSEMMASFVRDFEETALRGIGHVILGGIYVPPPVPPKPLQPAWLQLINEQVTSGLLLNERIARYQQR